MKKSRKIIYFSIIAVLMVIFIYKISALENKIESLSMDMNNRFSQLENDIRNVNTSVAQTLEEQSSLISSAEWKYTGTDIAKREVTVNCTVSPKTYTPQVTEAFIICGDKEYPMEFKGNKYTADIVLPMFSESNFTSVLFKENGTVNSQKLQWYINPRYECLPVVYARNEGRRTGSVIDDKFRVKNDLLIVIDIDGKNTDNKVKEVNLIYYMDGNEIKRENVDISYEGQAEYARSLSGNIQVSMPSKQEFESGNYSKLHYYMGDTVDIPFGKTYEVYADVVDSYDLHYRSICYDCSVDENGEANMSSSAVGGESIIMDKDGNVLFSAL